MINLVEPIEVIEVRKANNGWVVCAFQRNSLGPQYMRGYITRVVQSAEPKDVGDAVTQLLKDCPLTEDTVIPPSRALP